MAIRDVGAIQLRRVHCVTADRQRAVRQSCVEHGSRTGSAYGLRKAVADFEDASTIVGLYALKTNMWADARQKSKNFEYISS